MIRKHLTGKRKHLTFQFKVANVVKDASEECVIEGYANTADKDRVGDVVLPSAFEKSLPTYMTNPVLLANHDWNDPCGLVQHAEITDKGLFIRARISNTRPDIKTMIREGVLRTFSIGYNEGDADFDEATQTKFIKELELLEISIVTVPANSNALFTEVGANLPKQAEREDAEAQSQPKPNAEAPKNATPGETKTQVRSASDLMSFIADVKSAVEGDLSQTEIDAIGAYFINEKEDVMTRAELIALLKKKSIGASAPAPAADAGKAPAPAAPAEEKPAEGQPSADLGKMVEACMARLDAISQALAQLLEMQKADSEEDASEDKPAEGGDKPAEDKPADEGKDAGEMTDEELQKSLDEVEAQIAELEDDGNE